MSNDQFEREKLYQSSMAMFELMLDKGLITKKQYMFVEEKMQEKYKPIIGRSA